jgi:hypothetical protein
MQRFCKYSFQIRKASIEDANPPPGISDEELDAQAIEDALCPPDDPVESALAQIVGLNTVKNQIRGLRRTMEIELSQVGGGGSANSLRSVPRHVALVGNPGTFCAMSFVLTPNCRPVWKM